MEQLYETEGITSLVAIVTPCRKCECDSEIESGTKGGALRRDDENQSQNRN